MLYAITLNTERTGFLLHAFRSMKESRSTDNLLEIISPPPLFTLFQQARSQEEALKALKDCAGNLLIFEDEQNNIRPNQPARIYTDTYTYKVTDTDTDTDTEKTIEKTQQFNIKFYTSPHDMRKAEALDFKMISSMISLFRQRGPHARSVSIEQMIEHIDPNFFTVEPTPSSAP